MAQVKKNVRPVKKTYTSPFSIYWTKENYLLLLAGVVLLIAGYYVMSLGNWDNPVALTLSPILLVIGYLIVLPAAIFYGKRKNSDKTAGDTAGQNQ